MTSVESDILFLILTHMEEDGYTFWAQRHSPTIKLDLEHITNRLERISNGEAPRVKDVIEGGVYGCQFVDNFWYRCRVLVVISRSKCLVQYIDYGNFEEINQTSLVDIPIDFEESSMPPMAHRYRLHNLHIDDDNVEKACEYIKTKCSDDLVKAKLVPTSDSSFLEIILFDDEGISIGEQLIKSGLAVDATSYKAKKSVKISSAVDSQAQKFRNLLSLSPDKGNTSEDVNNNEMQILKKDFRNSQSSGLGSMQELEYSGWHPDGTIQGKKEIVIECENCQVNKVIAENMRLMMNKLRRGLWDSEYRIMSLIEREQYWKKRYMELKEEQICAECGVVVVMQQPKIERPVEREKPAEMKKIKDKDSPVRPRMDIVAKKQMDENFAKSSAIMNKVILPTFEFVKNLTSSNKIIDNYIKYDQDLKDVVGKIKIFLEKGENPIGDDFLALIYRRNAVVQDLRQTVHSTFPLVTAAEPADDIALQEKVEIFFAQLKKIILESDTCNKNVNATQNISIADLWEAIQIWKIDKETCADLSVIVQKLMTCLLEQSEKYHHSKELSAQVKATKAGISSFQSREKTIKEISEESKSMRKRRQKIRLLVAELKNIEEEEQHADDSAETLELQKEEIIKDLRLQRKDLQDCFENTWILMESLAVMVEKFTPEMQNDHPELGIGDYMKEKGMVMKNMEIDHFDVKSIEASKNLNIDVLHTDYGGVPIVLHKYPSRDVSEKSWDAVLKYIAIYTNVKSPNVFVPIGIFKEKDAVYVMVTVPRRETFPISEITRFDRNTVVKILNDVAAALNALHENGITHGQLSKNSVSASVQPNVLGYLSVPNFFQASGNTLLAEDIRQFGLLAKSLIRDAPCLKLQAAIEKCLKNPATMTMQLILEAF